jgi:hypothetical protein
MRQSNKMFTKEVRVFLFVAFEFVERVTTRRHSQQLQILHHLTFLHLSLESSVVHKSIFDVSFDCLLLPRI